MNKKLLLTIFAGAMMLGACKPIDPTIDLDEHTDCIVYSHDKETNTGVFTNYATIKVTGDMTSGLYALNFKDFKVADGETLRSATLSGLIQYMDDVTDQDGNLQEVHYTLFKQESSTKQAGDMDISNMQYSWLSTVFWLNMNALDGRYTIWTLPSKVQLYANKNFVKGPYGNNHENAITPRYDMTFNTLDHTVTIKASGVKYPVDVTDPSKSYYLRSLSWNNLPIELNEKGFTANVKEFSPTIDGTTDNFTITNFSMVYEVAYEGKREATFTLTDNTNGVKLVITTTLDYFMQANA